MDGVNAVNYILKNNIEGVFLECGVCAGLQEAIWIDTLQKNNETRDIYLFDTFKGCPKPTKHDYTSVTAQIYNLNSDETLRWWERLIIDNETNGMCYCPLDQVKKNLESFNYPNDKLHYIVGDVLQTLKDEKNIPDKIAILRLDTDWYESSKIELEVLYDKVVEGGIIIFDDYYHWEGQKKATDDFFKKRGLVYDFVNIGNKKTSAIFKKLC